MVNLLGIQLRFINLVIKNIKIKNFKSDSEMSRFFYDRTNQIDIRLGLQLCYLVEIDCVYTYKKMRLNAKKMFSVILVC